MLILRCCWGRRQRFERSLLLQAVLLADAVTLSISVTAYYRIHRLKTRSFLSKPVSKPCCRKCSLRRNEGGDVTMPVGHPTLQQMREELSIGEEFLAKYNRPGPRYTSYPTAPVWNDSFGPDELERVFEEAER